MLTAKDMREIAEEESLQAVGKENEPDYFEYIEKKGEEDALGRGNNEINELTNLETTEDDAE